MFPWHPGAIKNYRWSAVAGARRLNFAGDRRQIPCRDHIRLCRCHSTLLECGHGQAVMNIRLADEASPSGNAKDRLTTPREDSPFLSSKSTLVALGAR
jgi:hypothetical protein